jgi:hypothetical protein
MDFFTKKWSPPEIQDCGIWEENICGVRYKSLWLMVKSYTSPIFVKNSHERPFSIILKTDTGIFHEKWSPLEIQECDLWHANICGVSYRSLWLMIKGHATHIFVENSQE